MVYADRLCCHDNSSNAVLIVLVGLLKSTDSPAHSDTKTLSHLTPGDASITQVTDLVCADVHLQATNAAAALARCSNARGDTFLDPLPLELSHGANDAEHESAARRGKVQVVPQADE